MKNIKLRNFVSRLGYAISSNLLTMLISTIVIIILPKIIGVQSYGYWQLYIFYIGYVGFFHFGWCDGIYLKFGGKHYSNLEPQYFFSQFLSFVFLQGVVVLILSFLVFLISSPGIKFYIYFMIIVTLFLTNIRFFFIYILQSTNRIQESSKVTILDRIVYVTLIVTFLVIGIRDFKVLILSDIIARGISLLYSIYLCKELIQPTEKKIALDFFESIDNIKIGSNLMLSNIASTLIIGIIRFGIQDQWNIETFAKVSLTLSVSNLLMTFINAVGIVIFPMLKRAKENQYRTIFLTIRSLLTPMLFASLLIYFPLKELLFIWLPKYQEGLIYMGTIFPIVIFEGKTALLSNTFMKSLRYEKKILFINTVSLILSVILTIISVYFFKNLHLTILNIVIVLSFRNILSEIILSKTLNVSIFRSIIEDLSLTLLFIASTTFFDELIGLGLYLLLFSIYILSIKDRMKESIDNIKIYTKGKK